nr:12663_t:CDS:2 [Entrophospora candida]
MSNIVSQIKNLFLTGHLDAVCGANVVYLAMNGNNLDRYEDIRTLADHAVNSALMKITDTEQRTRVLEVLPEMMIAYKSIVGLRVLKALNMDREDTLDKTREEIEKNYNALKSNLSVEPKTDSDVSLYDALKKNLVKYINPFDLSWQDPEANMVLSDDSVLVEKLGRRQKRAFMEPCENMKCTLPESVVSKCEQFVCDFNETINTDIPRKIVHDKTWKEEISILEKRAERILSVLGEVWNNPAFEDSKARKEQSEGTYIVDVIMPLLRASLEDMPNGRICLSTAWQANQLIDEVKQLCSKIDT